MNLLEIQHVSKVYATKTAVDDITMSVPKGTIFGLLGPNGAGKTSLIRMVTHITLPDRGEIRFDGVPLQEVHQQQMGYMPEERGLYKKMKIGEQIEYLLTLKGVAPAAAKATTTEWLQRFELTEWRHRKVEELSKGMQQKVQFIATIAHRPPLLILDEPFSGLDPINAQLLEQTIMDLRDAGTTILFSTHRMEQVETFCSHIALVNNGKLILCDEVKPLRHRYRQNHYILEAEEDLANLDLPAGVQHLGLEAGRLRVALPEGEVPRSFLAWANERLTINRFELDLPSIRDIFIRAVRAAGGEVPVEALEPVPAS